MVGPPVLELGLHSARHAAVTRLGRHRGVQRGVRPAGQAGVGGALDEWMVHTDRLLPALANDDSHFRDEDRRDTFEAWTMVRTRERSATAIVDALASGAGYGTTGPVIHDIQLRPERSASGRRMAATVTCSEAKRIDAISDLGGASYREPDATFEQATFPLKIDARWVRFEVIAPDGKKAWSNPFDLTAR